MLMVEALLPGGALCRPRLLLDFGVSRRRSGSDPDRDVAVVLRDRERLFFGCDQTFVLSRFRLGLSRPAITGSSVELCSVPSRFSAPLRPRFRGACGP